MEVRGVRVAVMCKDAQLLAIVNPNTDTVPFHHRFCVRQEILLLYALIVDADFQPAVFGAFLHSVHPSSHRGVVRVVFRLLRICDEFQPHAFDGCLGGAGEGFLAVREDGLVERHAPVVAGDMHGPAQTTERKETGTGGILVRLNTSIPT